MQHLAPPDGQGATAHGGFEDEELTISLSPSRRNSRRNLDSNTKLSEAIAESRPTPAPAPASAPVVATVPVAAAASNNPPRNKPPPLTHDPDLIIAQRLAAYQIIKTLGEGSFGKVKLAMHYGTGKKVALKIIPRKKLISRDMAGRVEREIEYLQLLRHRHIIKLFTVIKTRTDIIMVLEYAGGELFDYIVQNGRMKEESARRFFQQMICAVEYCHRHKIVHRDLKPENLLLDNELDVKIADFGLSNIMTDGNFLKTSCGSPNYAAPEVISGKLYAGPEVDVWSCGVILYVMLVGRLPFDDDHIPSLFAKITRGNYSIPSWMPSGAANLIRRMLVVNPVQRATIEEIRQDPWFLTLLNPFLSLPVEEVFQTGIDPTKSIKKPEGASATEEERDLFTHIVDTISMNMGYTIEDVEEALGFDEPSAIKDAYLILRETEVTAQTDKAIAATMEKAQKEEAKKETQSSMDAPSLPPPIIPAVAPATASPSTPSVRSVHSSNAGNRAYVSKVGILPSSIPAYHKSYVDREKSGDSEDAVTPSVVHDDPLLSRTPADREETARRLRPHSRGSAVRLDDSNNARPQGLTPVNPPPKKVKPVRWQFGIRSRNAPWEALLCIHKALAKLGAAYIPDENWEPVETEEDAPPSYREVEDGRGSFDPAKRYKLPADPWNIKVRWETEALRKPSQPTPAPANIRRSSDGREFEVIAMFLEIQIYEMDRGVYLVDFKCAGYETWDHYMLDQKDVTSPFPFLDMAARLIMQLAEAD